MSLLRKGIFFLLILLLMIPVLGVDAQDDSPEVPIDDEFIDTLVMVMISKDFLQGPETRSNLYALRDYVEEYYEYNSQNTQNDIDVLQKRKNILIDKIDLKIGDALPIFDRMMNILINVRVSEENRNPIVKIVSGRDDVSKMYFDMIDDNERHSDFITNGGSLISSLLGIDTLSAVPSNAPNISNNKVEVNDSTAAINTPVIDDVLDENGTTINAPIDVDPPIIRNNKGQDSASKNSSTGTITDKQIVNFKNNGIDTVMVKAESYIPVDGLRGGIPGGSTVVGNGSNTSAAIELPLGVYTFCYEWELGSDSNVDGKTDYHHRSTGEYTIDSLSTSVIVTLNPDMIVSNPNGRCGESFNQTPVNTVDQSFLSPEEQANAGIYTFLDQCSGVIFGNSCDGDPSEEVTLSIEFDENGAFIYNTDGQSEVEYFTKIGHNQYYLDFEGSQLTITFNINGFDYYFYNAEADINANLFNTRQ